MCATLILLRWLLLHVRNRRRYVIFHSLCFSFLLSQTSNSNPLILIRAYIFNEHIQWILSIIITVDKCLAFLVGHFRLIFIVVAVTSYYINVSGSNHVYTCT